MGQSVRHRGSERASSAAAICDTPPELQPYGNQVAAELLRSDPNAPSSYPGDICDTTPDYCDLPDYYWAVDPMVTWGLQQATTKAVEKAGVPAGFASTVAEAPFVLGDDRNHAAEDHEREEREAMELFAAGLVADQRQAAEALAEQRWREQQEYLHRGVPRGAP